MTQITTTNTAIQQVDESLLVDFINSQLKNFTEPEKQQFLEICKALNLNPFTREIYGIKFGKDAQIIVGYEAYLKRAETIGLMVGRKVWTEGKGADLVAKIEIRRKDWEEPFYHEVDLAEYDQNKLMEKGNKFWREKPKTMLKKVVTSQGLRLCFPLEFAGMPYTSDELPSEPIPTDAEIEAIPAKPKIDIQKVRTNYKGYIETLWFLTDDEKADAVAEADGLNYASIKEESKQLQVTLEFANDLVLKCKEELGMNGKHAQNLIRKYSEELLDFDLQNSLDWIIEHEQNKAK